jgi:predicted MPP superfamily phosphohydrolase
VRRVLIVLSILVAIHVYIWWRLALPLPSPYWQIATTLVVVLTPSFPLMRRYARRLSRESAKPWLLLGYLWFGLAAYLLLGAVLTHVAVAFGADARLAAVVAIGASVIVVIAGMLQVARGALVRHVRIPIAGLPVASYTIAHLTDVHIGALIGHEFAEQMVRRVNALSPDLVVITGDLVDGHLAELRRPSAASPSSRAKMACWTGSTVHRHRRIATSAAGIRVLRNEHVTLDSVVLAGVDDSTAGEDVPAAVAGRDPQRPLVLLAHHPRTIARARKAGVDLQLSGHTHGGQLLPLGYLARLFDPKVSGLARFGATWLYVSQGTGFWGPPLRVGTTCEISAITLVPA